MLSSSSSCNSSSLLSPSVTLSISLSSHPLSRDPAKYGSLDATKLSDWLSEKAKGLWDPKGCVEAVRDWFFELENFPYDLSQVRRSHGSRCIILHARARAHTHTNTHLPGFCSSQG